LHWLISSLVEGEYTAPSVGCGIVIAMAIISQDEFRSYDP